MTEAWSIQQCTNWLTAEVLSGRCTYQKFLERASGWQIKQYALHDYPEQLPYADQSLLNLVQAAKGVGLLDDELPKKHTTILSALQEQENNASK